MTQEQCDRYNNWVDAYNRVVYGSNKMVEAYNDIIGAINALKTSYRVDYNVIDNNKLQNLASNTLDRIYQIQRVVLPYIQEQMRKIENE